MDLFFVKDSKFGSADRLYSTKSNRMRENEMNNVKSKRKMDFNANKIIQYIFGHVDMLFHATE